MVLGAGTPRGVYMKTTRVWRLPKDRTLRIEQNAGGWPLRGQVRIGDAEITDIFNDVSYGVFLKAKITVHAVLTEGVLVSFAQALQTCVGFIPIYPDSGEIVFMERCNTAEVSSSLWRAFLLREVHPDIEEETK